jgi:secondary thiamine-phosphate synthase enzyme
MGAQGHMIQHPLAHSSAPFGSYSEELRYETGDGPQFTDITEDVLAVVERASITNGIAVIFSQHTTAAIKINECEPELIKDMTLFLNEIAPVEKDYFHNDFDVRTVNMTEDECPNAHSHCQHLLLSASESVPIIAGQLHLGRWQRIFLVELDRPKTRRVTVQILGT